MVFKFEIGVIDYEWLTVVIVATFIVMIVFELYKQGQKKIRREEV